LANLKTISQNLAGGTEENHRNFTVGQESRHQFLDPAHFEYETGLLNFQTGLVVAQWLELFSRNQSDSDIG
jgi:hypothetical protein